MTDRNAELNRHMDESGFPTLDELAIAAEHGTPLLIACQWFALCDHTATHTRPHPILGDVPICDRCEAKVTALEAS